MKYLLMISLIFFSSFVFSGEPVFKKFKCINGFLYGVFETDKGEVELEGYEFKDGKPVRVTCKKPKPKPKPKYKGRTTFA